MLSCIKWYTIYHISYITAKDKEDKRVRGGEMMKVSIVQMDVRLADPEYNFSHAEELIRKAAAEKPDVIRRPGIRAFSQRKIWRACRTGMAKK